MNRCPSLEQLSQFLDEALDAAEAGRLSENISRCDECQSALERLTAAGDSDLVSLSSASISRAAAAEGSLAFLENLKQAPGAAANGAPPVVRGATRIPDIDGYEIREVLGRGGMGIVYRAEQVGLNRVVALKMILAGPHASARDHARFRQEAEAVARLTHVNIVQVFDVGESAGLPYFGSNTWAAAAWRVPPRRSPADRPPSG